MVAERGRGVRHLARGVLAGAAGTASMTLTGRTHRLVVASSRGIRPGEIEEILDYDDSDHVVVAAGTVLAALTGWSPTTPAQRRALFFLTHWGYGSAVGVTHAELRRRVGEPAAGLLFFAACQTMALGLFPVLGGTPVPWRWRRDLVVTSFAQHIVYAAGVAGGHAALRRAGRRRLP